MSSSSTAVRLQVAASPQSSVRVRAIIPVIAGGFAGLLAGVDTILVAFLAAMLGGTTAPDLAVAGIGHAGWSAAQGIEAGLDAGGVVIVFGLTMIGALTGWSLRCARGHGRRPLAAA
jgi:hypothetical protein